MCKRLVVPPVLLFAMAGLQPALAQGSGVHARSLPAPPVSADAPPVVFLQAARAALAGGRTGEAQEAMERVEARMLNRAVDATRAASPDSDRAVLDVGAARQALAAHDRPGAARAIDDAIGAVSSPLPAAPIASAPVVVASPPSPPPPEPPPVTRALLPGHWQLRGANYVWMPPETTLRRVEERLYVQGRYAWRSGAWVWLPAHYQGG